MTECRKRVPVILAGLDEMLTDPELSGSDKLTVYDMVFNRAFGKPRQQIFVSDDTSNSANKRVQVYLPDNGRPSTINRTIDVEVA
jgi:hypothetical protein